MSRSKAKKTFTLADHAAATAGVEYRKDADVIGETPGAYKAIDDVMAAQADLVDIVYADSTRTFEGWSRTCVEVGCAFRR